MKITRNQGLDFWDSIVDSGYSAGFLRAMFPEHMPTKENLEAGYRKEIPECPAKDEIKKDIVKVVWFLRELADSLEIK